MREMKDSGIAWIGAIPNHWKVSKIKQIVCWKSVKGQPDLPVLSLYRDYGVVPKDSRDDNHNVTSLDTSGYKVVEHGDLVINKMKAWQGSLAVSEYNGIVSPAYHICKITSENICKKYLHYLLRDASYLPEYMRLSTGLRVGQWDLSFDDFKNIPFLVPPLAEQERIAAFLDAECAEIDAVLEKTRASIEEYKKLKQAVITQAITKGVRGDRPMKSSGIEWIGDIPAEWEVVRQKYFWNTVESGVSVNAADKPVDNSEQYGVLKTSAVSKFVFIPAEHKQVNFEEYGRVSCPVRADSIIASRMNTPELVGACGYVQNNYPNLFLPDRLWQITFKDGLSPKYAWYYLSGIRVRQYISSLSTGTSSSMQNISQSQYGNIFITIPDLEEQSEITKYLDEKCSSVDALMAKKQQYLTEIENYKKSLIYEYVTGKREV
mgnify:CR=1 FL=1